MFTSLLMEQMCLSKFKTDGASFGTCKGISLPRKRPYYLHFAFFVRKERSTKDFSYLRKFFTIAVDLDLSVSSTGKQLGWVDDVQFHVLVNGISVTSGRSGISRRWLDENERVCAMEYCLRLEDFCFKRDSNPRPLDQQMGLAGPEVIKIFRLNSIEHGFFLLINIKCQKFLVF